MTTWMELEDIMQSKIASHRRKNNAWIHLHEVFKMFELRETGNRTVVAWSLAGRESGELIFKEYQVFVIQGKHVLEIYYTTLCL